MQQEVNEVVGFDAVSVVRVQRAMQDLGLRWIETDADARAVMTALQLDGLVTGVITAWDEYRPLQLGLATQLHLDDAYYGSGRLNVYELERATGLPAAPGELGPERAVAQSSRIFDGSSHQTLKWLRHYADGRTEVDSAYGTEIYQVSMEMFARFACYQSLTDLLSQERERMAHAASEQEAR